MRKLLSFVAAMVAAAMAIAGVASAGSNYANGTTISATGTMSFGGMVTCTASLSGPLTNLSPGATVLIKSATFTNCVPSGSSVSVCNLNNGWDVTLQSTTDDNVWSGSMAGVCTTITTVLTGQCQYQGTLTGTTYTNSTHTLAPAGNLTRVSGACSSTASVSGSLTVSPSDFAINTN